MTTDTNRLNLEVDGGQVPLIRDVLTRVKLSSSITRFKLEIESDTDILTKDTSTQQDTTQETPPDQTPEKPDSAERADRAEPETDDAPTAKLLNSSRSVEDSFLASAAIETGEPAYHYENVDGVDADDPVPDDFEKFTHVLMNPDTMKWHLIGLLYRANTTLALGDIHKALEDTDWEANYSSISPYLSDFKKAGLTYVDTSGKNGHNLTELGRDYFKSICKTTEGYHLKVADDIVRDHPDIHPRANE